MNSTVTDNSSTSGAPSGQRAPSQPGISLFTATCIVIANMIGTGVFTSLGFQVAATPSEFPIMMLWLLGGVCALCGALCYGELAAALPRSGGEYHFLSVIFHPWVGFLAGWISVTVGFAAPVALAAMAFGEYFHTVFPNVPALPLSLGVVGLVTLVHLRGVAFGSVFQNYATGLKVLLLVVMVGAGFLAAPTASSSFLPKPGDSAVMLSAPFAVSLVYVMYAYSGWNASTYIVGEVRNAARVVPFSVILGTLIVTILYIAVNAAFLRTTPMPSMAGKVEVAQIAATSIFGNAGGKLMAGLICAGLISSVSAMTWIGPRVAKTMGEDWRALGWLAKTTATGVPAIAIVTQSTIVALLLISSSFDAVLTYVQFALQFCSFLTVVGLIVLRIREPKLNRPVRAFGYPLTPAIFLAISAWMLWHIFSNKPWESLAGLGTMLVGLAFYFASKRRPAGV